ncbi:hypothetical protein Taro_016496 [Colocasia esculenta]|uniref:X8 domain-containing protein n=1 Tax=Colocasia esculenta TaxID=4460 RepID=A0A843UNP0_COLES|nr:hypothetical protein [Colocasia esculenta]
MLSSSSGHLSGLPAPKITYIRAWKPAFPNPRINTQTHCPETVGLPETTEGDSSMALSSYSRTFSFLLLFVTYISTAAGGLLGVDYGRDASNIIPPQRVVELLKANGIGAAAIYDDDVGVIQAFRDSGIKLVVSLRNEKLADAARDPNYAGTWVWEHVGKFFPATQIEAIAVGNEVLDKRLDLAQHLLPAMQNVYNAVKNLGYADRIKISSPVAFSTVSVSFPPSQGRFRNDLKNLVRQLLDFLQRTDSYFMVNLYPFITYRDVPNIDLDYFLGQPNYPGVRDTANGRIYKRLLDAQIDATYTAMADLGFGVSDTPTATTVGASLQRGVKRKIAVKETGCPNCSSRRRRRNQVTTAGVMLNTSLAEKGCSLWNAQTYNRNLVERMLSGQTGTPLFPNSDMDVYIFSLFNENLKPGAESEKSFGLFYPDGTKVYDMPSFSAAGSGSWCVANPAVGQQRMQAALDWACGQGGADCGPIQPGAACYEPNTVEAHASYAMNSYYQRRGRGAGTCDFSGVGQIVYQRPRFGNCNFPSSK